MVTSFLINDSGLSEDEIVYSIEATKDGGFVSVGSTNGMGARGLDIYFIKQDSNIINYVSIVGIKESFSNDENKGIEVSGQKLLIDSKTAVLLDFITIYDLQGNIINKWDNQDLERDLLLNDVTEGFFIVRLFYKDGRSETKKVFIE